jgi:MFS family permease
MGEGHATVAARADRASAFTVVGIALASALVPLNSTMIAVALPTLADEFDITTGSAGVLITVYLVAMLIGQPLAGRLADLVGARRLAIIAVTGFGACSAAAMFATTFPMIVAIRAGQAIFASAVSPSVQALLRMVTTTSDRGRAFGLQGSVIGVGAGLGPVIGGLLLAGFGWQAIFAVNVPIVIVVLAVLRRTVLDDSRRSAALRAQADAAGVADSRLMNPVFTAAFSTQSLATLAQYALLLIAPIVLDDRGWGAGQIGLALSALTLGIIVMSPLGGRMGDEWGRRRPVMFGLALALVAIVASAGLGQDVSSAMLIATLLVFGLGLGFATPSVTTAGMEAAPEDRIGLASGLLSMSRYVGSIVASVLLTVLVTDDGGGVSAMLRICVIAVALSLVAATRLPRHPS